MRQRPVSAGLLLCSLLALPLGAPRAEPGGREAIGDRPSGIVLQRLPAPDTDTIRLAVSRPSIVQVRDLGDGVRLIQLDRFGRKLDHELSAALAGARNLILDLRANRGGSLRRMLRAAARLTGPVADALVLRGTEENTRSLSIPVPEDRVWQGQITVLVGAGTLSSAEVLAALLRRFAGATVLGERTFGKDYVLRVEPIDQEWHALVPAAKIVVPDEQLEGGLLPDGPIPVALSLEIATN